MNDLVKFINEYYAAHDSKLRIEDPTPAFLRVLERVRIRQFLPFTASLSAEERAAVPETVCPMLTLEEFFDGNTDEGCIWCNLSDPPPLADIRSFLESIRDRADVDNVYVMVTSWDGGNYWPFSDTIWIVTSASEEEVADWIPEEYAPDEISTGFFDHYKCEQPPIPPGMAAVSLWYD